MTRKKVLLVFGFAPSAIGYLSSSETPRHPCVGAGALSPRRRVEPCGTRALGGGAWASRLSFAARCSVCLSCCCTTERRTRRAQRRRRAPCTARSTPAVHPASRLDGVNLPSHLVAYQAPTTTTTAPPATTTTAAAPAPTTTPPTVAPRTTTTVAPPPPADDDDHGRTAAGCRPGKPRVRGGHLVLGRSVGHVREPDAALRDGGHGRQRGDRCRDRLHGGRPRGRPATHGWSTSRRRASPRSPTSAREWWTSQSPGDPLRRRHRPVAVGARAAPQQGARAELRR